jgi:hypothetical protein
MPPAGFKKRYKTVNNPAVPPGPGTGRTCRQNPIFDGLPGRANATIRSPAAPIDLDRRGFGTAPSQSFNALIAGSILLRETALPGPVRSGQGLLFAPFVYRLGRHPFTVERAVRFR